MNLSIMGAGPSQTSPRVSSRLTAHRTMNSQPSANRNHSFGIEMCRSPSLRKIRLTTSKRRFRSENPAKLYSQGPARVAVGQAEHVANILAQAGLAEAATTAEAIEGAVEHLTLAGVQPYHRDGWMFQVMSWIAAHRHTPGGLIRAPHMIHAHKEFDGIQIDLDSNSGAVTAVVVFEDKAGRSPRQIDSILYGRAGF